MAGSTLSLPVIGLEVFLADPTSAEAIVSCKAVAAALQEHGALSIRDPRVSEADNGAFVDLMEAYFSQEASTKALDERPEVGYQVGSTPAFTEIPRCAADDECVALVERLLPDDKPAPFDTADAKERFFWRVGTPPPPGLATQFLSLHAVPVVPPAFADVWQNQMDAWGAKLLAAVRVVAEMLAVGLGLPQDAIAGRTDHAPHLLAPTGSDLSGAANARVGRVLAGFHTDLNLLTIHGKSRFPGLNIWDAQNHKLRAKIPDGCLLVQAGKQLEYLTAGHIKAGFHEVVVTDDTLTAIAKQTEAGRPLWRISSTLFFHCDSDSTLEPLPIFATPESFARFPPLLAGTQVQHELGLINLSAKA
ncbi:hypothetical protein HK100_004109 [Physocladia obscura]|uniref:Isopenicillin N synthase-like Fe(2+) 2OG dioxygenase domain-containing protein n=1 Tax=Physocladia obscura TaxID=109957 RepID=A0AAD5SVV3_9FUNG|nr:hypothetical protein HK100_004109 [Physocladia obscura]